MEWILERCRQMIVYFWEVLAMEQCLGTGKKNDSISYCQECLKKWL